MAKKVNSNNEYMSEADVETKYIYDILIKKVLECPSKSVAFHVPVEMTQGRKTVTKEADVVIKDSNNENWIVIDSKAPTEKLEKFFSQIDSYAFALETPISILSNYHRMIVRIYLSGNKKQVVLDKQILELEKNNYADLKEVLIKYSGKTKIATDSIAQHEFQIEQLDNKKITDYRRLFRQIHTKIRSIDKLDPSASFDEFSKVLFIKIINDKVSEQERLTVEDIKLWKTQSQQSAYIDKWFQDNVNKYYSGIFAINEKISLSPTTLCQVLNMLNECFDLKDSLTDVKGRAFEEFLPSQLRGKGLGQFFTPRSVVDFMIELAEISITDTVLDFASGSGGFLIKAFDKKRQLINETQQQYLDLVHKTREELLEDTKSQFLKLKAPASAGAIFIKRILIISCRHPSQF